MTTLQFFAAAVVGLIVLLAIGLCLVTLAAEPIDIDEDRL
jgi:hypothetical protein